LHLAPEVEVAVSKTKPHPRRAPDRRDDRLRALLSERGLRVTEQRLEVLRALSWSRVPVTFPELVDRLGDRGLDRATIFRNLVGLAEAGILARSQLGDGAWRYELPDAGAPTHEHHPHLLCVDCGVVSCLPVGTVTIRGDAAKRVTEVQLRGHCAACMP
jgi:Fur family ferric uptake transcriptional regulator